MKKRIFDVATALLILAVTLPLMAAVALILLAERNGPVIFKQERIGKQGKPFTMYKFRTMRTGARGPSITVGGDRRVTLVGGWLRKTKVDELPQLFNVLMGEMSVVGPRPEVPEYVELWPESSRDVILSVRPGITDPASVRFRHEAAELAQFAQPEIAYAERIIPEKVSIYVDYVRRQSLWGDIRLIVATCKALVAPARLR